MNHKSPVIRISNREWLHAVRMISRSTDERAIISGSSETTGYGHSALNINYIDNETAAVASALVMANMNSIPLDWAARTSVGGTNLSFFIVKQLPVLPPDAYLETVELDQRALTWVELVVPRVLELVYTSWSLQSFAVDLGYEGEPFTWDDDRRHRQQSELDAIYAHMYGLERNELEWILDAQYPSASFPTLKKNETSRFGEYRTQRYVLTAFDAIQRGEGPNLANATARVQLAR